MTRFCPRGTLEAMKSFSETHLKMSKSYFGFAKASMKEGACRRAFAESLRAMAHIAIADSHHKVAKRGKANPSHTKMEKKIIKLIESSIKSPKCRKVWMP